MRASVPSGSRGRAGHDTVAGIGTTATGHLDVVAAWTDADPERPTVDHPDAPLSVARERLEHALANPVRVPIPPERIVATPLHGSAGEVLVARARDARLLALGTSGIECPTIPGPTGLYCLRHSAAPVVFVPAPDA
ncbi:hypothetical protein [Embleya sp. NPDC050493]|uniref:hypothetical protein n=1 Tax=Embleya sp. NPDC050493 TaxID=3363989 RepID=UPI0037A0784F